MEILTFEVVGFHGTYHAVLGCPCYAKFMVVPNYTYLKLKMPGPKGIITISTSIQCAYKCEVESCELASMVIASEELLAVHQMDDEEAPNTKKVVGSFKTTKDTKEILIDPSGLEGKTMRIGATLTPK